MKRKICHLTSVHRYDDIRIFIKECNSLISNGYEVHLVAPNTNKDQFIVDGVIIHGINRKPKNRLDRIIINTRLVYKKALEIDADLYHFHDPELIPIGLKLIKKGKKVIYDVHEDVPRQIFTKHWIPKPFQNVISKTFEIYENRSSKKFTAIITATPHIKERFINNNNNTIDIRNYPLLDEFIFSTVNINKKRNIVTYIGRISSKRGLFTMIRSVSKLSDVRLNLAGNISDQKEYEKAKEMVEWDNVDYLGLLNRKEIVKLLSQSKAGLVILHPETNYIDSLPIKMFEYMAAGIPVIASKFPLWEEIINNSKCGICVDPLNTEEIVAAIKCILDNPEKAEQMGKNGQKAVKELYNWEKESNKLLELYEKII